MYVAALREAYQAALKAEGDAQGDALQLFGELGQRIANSYASFVSGAASALLQIVKGGMDYALEVNLSPDWAIEPVSKTSDPYSPHSFGLLIRHVG